MEGGVGVFAAAAAAKGQGWWGKPHTGWVASRGGVRCQGKLRRADAVERLASLLHHHARLGRLAAHVPPVGWSVRDEGQQLLVLVLLLLLELLLPVLVQMHGRCRAGLDGFPGRRRRWPRYG